MYPKLYTILKTAPLLIPLTAFAQVADSGQVDLILNNTQAIFNTIVIPVAFLLLTIIFLWGVVKYVLASQDEKAREQAKAIMTWGIIGLFVAAAAWGIVNLLINYFGVGGVGTPGTGGTLPVPIQ